MIIGLSGYAGSGKNTVGSIIQYLIAKDIIEGYKKTVPNCASIVPYDEYDKSGLESASRWQIKAFAQKLKQIAALLTGISEESMDRQEVKAQQLGKEWDTLRIHYLNDAQKAEIHPSLAKSYTVSKGVNSTLTLREFLQLLGTDAIRDHLHRNTWVNALMVDYKPKDLATESDEQPHLIFPNWIITDMRFPNECDAVKAKDGITIRVNRKWMLQTEVNGTPLHSSETALDNHKFDYTIDNSGTIDELIPKVAHILKQLKLIE